MIQISNRSIGQNYPPFIIAEMSGNHNQSLVRALEIVEAAANAGAHALKLQTYTAETMTLKSNNDLFKISDQGSPWCGNTLYELYQNAYTPWEWHAPIFERARRLGMIPFSSPFDETAVDFLEKIDAPCYKIASFENTDLPLLRRVAATGKPVIMSTGMATLAELDESIRTLRQNGCKDLILLKCTSTYPASPSNSNILTMPELRKIFSCEVGMSDHTLGIGVSVASIALGASVVEKHFTLSRADGGVDSTFSMEPEEMRQLVIESERAWLSLGEIKFGATGEENNSLKFRRSLYIVKDLSRGDILSPENVRAIRPAGGLPPKYLDVVIGKRVNCDVKCGTPLNLDLLWEKEADSLQQSTSEMK